MPTFLLSYTDWGLLVLRVVMGITFILHGFPKFKNLPQFGGWLKSMGVPAPSLLAVVVAVVEAVGGVLLILGLATQWAALFIGINMVVATILKKTKMGKKWVEGYELDLALVAGALVLLTAGAGAYSLDSAFLIGVK